LYISWWSFVVSVVVIWVVTLFTESLPDDRLKGLVYRLVEDDETTQAALRSRAE
ncbi:MAG: hypothetical protein GXO73_05690, partial [Calditrichaeota bacterium]|nr:hypothetical protein [Calditrichota bacterium]